MGRYRIILRDEEKVTLRVRKKKSARALLLLTYCIGTSIIGSIIRHVVLQPPHRGFLCIFLRALRAFSLVSREELLTRFAPFQRQRVRVFCKRLHPSPSLFHFPSLFRPFPRRVSFLFPVVFHDERLFLQSSFVLVFLLFRFVRSAPGFLRPLFPGPSVDPFPNLHLPSLSQNHASSVFASSKSVQQLFFADVFRFGRRRVVPPLLLVRRASSLPPRRAVPAAGARFRRRMRPSTVPSFRRIIIRSRSCYC